MKYSKLLILPLLVAVIFSCQKNVKTEIAIVDEYIDTSFGFCEYLVYASDTNWMEIGMFSDSLRKCYNNRSFEVITFYYPQHSIPRFKRTFPFPFALKFPSKDSTFVIARYYDTSFVHSPVLVRYPEKYKRAKKYEKRLLK